MPVARLLSVTLLFCSSLAFSQTQSHLNFDAALKPDSNLLSQLLPGLDTPATFAEPWQIMRTQLTDSQNTPNDQAKVNAEAERAARLFASIPYDPNIQHPWVKFSPDGKIIGLGVAEDKTCLVLRTYVVERDSRDSDATHLVRSSTCQPANRYGLKTTVMTSGDSDR
jgi:hypothetical protein